MSSARRIWVMPSLSRSFLMRPGKSNGSSGLAGTTFLVLCYMPIFKPYVKLYKVVLVYPNNIASAIREPIIKRIAIKDTARTLEDYISDFA
jgi:hypothetical protein